MVVLSVAANDAADVSLLVLNDCLQEREELEKLCIVEVVTVPVIDLNAVVRASAVEVLLQVVDDDRFLDVSSYESKIFDRLESLLDLSFSFRCLLKAMLAVQAMLDVLALVNSIHNPVCIVLHCSRENNYLIKLRELGQELVAVRSNHIEKVIFSFLKFFEVSLLVLLLLGIDEVYECLIKVKDQRILALDQFLRGQIWRTHLRQVPEVVWLLGGLLG